MQSNFWQQAKHADLYSDLLQTQQTGPSITPGSQHKRSSFPCPQYPTAEKMEKGFGQNEAECTGKVDMNNVEFLPPDEACKLDSFLLQS